MVLKPMLLTAKKSKKTTDFKISIPVDWNQELLDIEQFLKDTDMEFSIRELLLKDFKKYLDKVKKEIKSMKTHQQSPINSA